jgi:hypothetical protein
MLKARVLLLQCVMGSALGYSIDQQVVRPESGEGLVRENCWFVLRNRSKY